jgi:hypothetical protein
MFLYTHSNGHIRHQIGEGVPNGEYGQADDSIGQPKNEAECLNEVGQQYSFL